MKKLSFAQKEIMNLERYYENTSINNISGIIYLKNQFDYSDINRALNALVKNNESYRINIVKKEGEYRQIIKEYEYSEYSFIDFYKSEEKYEKWVDEEANRNIFNIEQDLYNFNVLRLPNGEYGVFLQQHHLISDGWSMTIAINFLKNELLNVGNSEENFSYVDSIEAELLYENSNRMINDEKYWDSKIKTLDNNQLFNNQEINAASQRKTIYLNKTQSKKIQNYCSANSISISNLFSAVFLLIKKTITKSNVNSVGMMIHNRNTKHEKNTIGLFSRVLPLIVDINDNLTVNEYLQLIKKEAFGLLKHRKYPYYKITNNLKNTKGLLEVIISFQNTQYDSEFKEYELSDEWINKDTNDVPLSISISNRIGGESLTIDYDYQQSILDGNNVEIIHNRIVNIIDNFLDCPDKTIKDIDIYTEEERKTIINEFNNTYKPLDNDKTVIEIFEKQVQKTPKNVAVVYEEETLTYEELNKRANQLGRKLRSEGVQPNSLVGLMTDRRLEMIIGIYGILKAGGAYVPIDPNYPSERINYILEDSQLNILLTDRDLEDSIKSPNHVINITKPSVYKENASDNLDYVNTSKDLIYVIYTSGTTGNPKGVMVPYRGVMNRLNWMSYEYELNSKDIMLFKTPYTFDVSVWEIFGWVTFGGKIVLLPSGMEGNPKKITELIEKHQVTMTHFVPSMLSAFLTDIKQKQYFNNLQTLNYVLTTGEELKSNVVSEFNELLGKPNQTMLINLYGPTEASVEVTKFECENDVKYEVIPIGKPIFNTQIYILNSDDNLLGINVPGELCIAGEGVAKGYLNRPELTNEKFIDNPFGKGKLYRTGDLAKWQADGNIQFLGRMDDQVKIRGYRIELGEIENNLLQLDEIENVVVTAKSLNNSELTLCAYLISDQSLNLDQVKIQLRQKLPEYMIPMYMMQIDELPVTSNGKLNKKAL
ncbi:amino acid adenylation domain-containing protein, partial [Staphylococcus epidermidis]|uniref:non-ribosomal peptide synthetase n=1 Tax=Staphylococcus epidermidis TaxID=1282 RepID=UPI001E3C9DC4